MPLYEKRTYDSTVGQMPEVVRLYREIAWPVMERDGFADYCVGYFISDTGTLHQLVHIWRFDNDEGRRDFWQRLYANEDFMVFAAQVRQLIKQQDVQLLRNAPWGPQP